MRLAERDAFENQIICQVGRQHAGIYPRAHFIRMDLQGGNRIRQDGEQAGQ